MRFLLITLLSLGLFFRLAHLDHKIYWYDETFTSLRAAGYTEAEVVQHFATSSIVSTAALQQYQHPTPDKGITDTWQSLAQEDNQHPPLYYTLANLWSRWVGSSVAAYRLLPALLSLLGLPAVYWLCQELFVKIGQFNTALPAWVGVGLFAISPLQINYAQESRQYSLWGTATLLMTAALLRAMRVQTRTSWGLYALTVAINLYTFLLSGLVVIAHGVYVLLQGKLRLQRSWFGYLAATGIAIASFLPWAWVLVHNLSQAQSVTSWTNTQQSLPMLILTWISIIGRVFYDRGDTLIDRLIQLGMVGLVGYAFYHLCRHTSRRVWLLIGMLTAMPVLPLMLADLALGGLRSTFPRYFLPALIGIQLAVVYLLSAELTRQPMRHCGRWLMVAVCCAGIISCVASFQASTWWQKTLNQENLAVAQMINQSTRPLLVSDAETGDLLSLSNSLNADTALMIRPRCYTCQIKTSESLDSPLISSLIPVAKNYRNVFLFHPRSSKIWRQSLENNQNFRFEFVPLNQSEKNKVLWRIVNK